MTPHSYARFRNAFLILLVTAISAAFLYMIGGFLTALLVAAIAAGLCDPMHQALCRRFGGRATAAALATLAVVFFAIIGPLLTVLGVVAAQAIEVSNAARPWIEEQLASGSPSALLARFELPAWLAPYQAQLLSRAGELAGMIGSFAVSSVASATRGTASFLFSLAIMLYAMFFFLRDGRAILARILYYMPLEPEDEARMVGKFVAVTRATLRGTLAIGLVQGSLAGAAFGVAGIQGPVFWGSVMAVLSIVPGVGAALVWVPAALWLYATGHAGAAIGLVLWCSAVIGSVDNLLRPRLVGRDTQMSDLLVLLSTLGGLATFGAVGVVAGPILAALFVTIWEIYGAAFAAWLPGSAGSESSS
jgi:predicted PurR-regulated permease PerM